jgi:hypothetical protein
MKVLKYNWFPGVRGEFMIDHVLIEILKVMVLGVSSNSNKLSSRRTSTIWRSPEKL